MTTRWTTIELTPGEVRAIRAAKRRPRQLTLAQLLVHARRLPLADRHVLARLLLEAPT